MQRRTSAAKRLSFGLLAFVSSLMACFIIYMMLIVSMGWLDYGFDVTIWAIVIAVNTIGLILLWRVSNKGYQQLWKLPKTKAKNEDFVRLEIPQTEEDEIHVDDEQSQRKSHP